MMIIMSSIVVLIWLKNDFFPWGCYIITMRSAAINPCPAAEDTFSGAAGNSLQYMYSFSFFLLNCNAQQLREMTLDLFLKSSFIEVYIILSIFFKDVHL